MNRVFLGTAVPDSMSHSFASLVLLCLLLFAPEAGADDTPSLSSDNQALEQRLLPLKKQAEKGDLHAAQQVYMRYGVAGHPEQARAWAARYNEILGERADKGDTNAMLQLGARYLRGGDYTPRDVPKATELFSRAGEAGDPTGLYMLGELFSEAGNAAQAQQSYARAYEIYAKRAEGDKDVQALYWIGFMEQNGIGTAKNAEQGIAHLQQAAHLGSAWAQAQLFKTFYKGIGTPRDPAKAISYARRLADEHKDALMAYVVACAYLYGRDVPQDTTIGEAYLDRAVAGNIPDAIYLKSDRLEQAGKKAEALPLLRQAASMKQKEAMERLGGRMLRGESGVTQDVERGLFMLENASTAQAAMHLALYYEEVGEQDIADSWYVTASDRGMPQAMARRGLLHLIPGGCVTWDPTRCYQWWRVGADRGDSTCKLYLRLFLYVFTPLLLLLVFGLPIYVGLRARRNRL